jgi:DNA-directed RNA polymerase subunit alpha
MSVKYGKFEMPERIKTDGAAQTATFARFIVEPFERGFGHTVGNVLRRIMLASLEAPAIISIRIEGVPHEYMAIPGIIQDMTHIVLNLKGALLRRPNIDTYAHPRDVHTVTKQLDITEDMIEKGGGEYVVTVKDLFSGSDYEVVNPAHVLFSVTKPMSKRVDIKVGTGRGYVPSERHVFEKNIDEIIIDTSFSPVRLVNYYVENTRVGQDTDFDRLIIEVKTDGRVSPHEALAYAAQIGIHHLQVFQTVSSHGIHFGKGESTSNRDRDEILQKLALRIDEIELSVRSTNCLENANIKTIGELVVISEAEMLRYRNFGKKSLTEIKQKLDELGLTLEMDLGKYGINRDNVKQMIQTYMQEKVGNVEI